MQQSLHKKCQKQKNITSIQQETVKNQEIYKTALKKTQLISTSLET